MTNTGAEIFNWVDVLPGDLRHAVISRMKTMRVNDGALLFEHSGAAKGLYRIVHGKVRLFSLGSDGRELIYKICGAPETIGDLAAIDGGVHTMSAEAITDCELLFLPRSALNELRHQHAVLETFLLSFVSKLARAAIISTEVATIYPLPARIASRLVFLAASARARGECVRELKIAQKDIGVMVGASRQAVNKTLADFQSLGLVETHYGSLRIIDIDGLRGQSRHLPASSS